MKDSGRAHSRASVWQVVLGGLRKTAATTPCSFDRWPNEPVGHGRNGHARSTYTQDYEPHDVLASTNSFQ
jgi:hypothetical protein